MLFQYFIKAFKVCGIKKNSYLCSVFHSHTYKCTKWLRQVQLGFCLHLPQKELFISLNKKVQNCKKTQVFWFLLVIWAKWNIPRKDMDHSPVVLFAASIEDAASQYWTSRQYMFMYLFLVSNITKLLNKVWPLQHPVPFWLDYRTASLLVHLYKEKAGWGTSVAFSPKCLLSLRDILFVLQTVLTKTVPFVGEWRNRPWVTIQMELLHDLLKSKTQIDEVTSIIVTRRSIS